MTVGELIDELSGIPANTPVILSRDGEGNGFLTLDDISKGFLDFETPWSGDYYDADDDYRPDDVAPVVCLWPAG